MKRYCATAYMSASGKLGGGVLALLAGYLMKVVYLLPMVLLWRVIAADGGDLGGMTLDSLLTYTCVSSMLSPLLNVRTDVVTWNYEGSMIDLYRRPQGLFGQIIATTAGKWVPELLLYSLPLAIVISALGVRLLPATPWFLLCLALSVSLGFAVDMLFFCFMIHVPNALWMAYSLRYAMTSLLSGAVIPFALLPWGLGGVFELLPFGSMAAAPLAVFIGALSPARAIPLQLFWNLTLWPLAVLAFRGNRERLVSYGG